MRGMAKKTMVSIRISGEHKEIITRAARLKGKNFTQYIILAALEKALNLNVKKLKS